MQASETQFRHSRGSATTTRAVTDLQCSHQRSSRCIPSTCPCPASVPRFDKSLNVTDTSSNYRLSMFFSFTHTKNTRYGDTKTALRYGNSILNMRQETLNFWKQLTHVLKYFRAEEDPKARLPKNFIEGFLEVCRRYGTLKTSNADCGLGEKLEIKSRSHSIQRLFIFQIVPCQTPTPRSQTIKLLMLTLHDALH